MLPVWPGTGPQYWRRQIERSPGFGYSDSAAADRLNIYGRVGWFVRIYWIIDDVDAFSVLGTEIGA